MLKKKLTLEAFSKVSCEKLGPITMGGLRSFPGGGSVGGGLGLRGMGCRSGWCVGRRGCRCVGSRLGVVVLFGFAVVGIAMAFLVHAFMEHFGFFPGVLVARDGGSEEGGECEEGGDGFHEGVFDAA